MIAWALLAAADLEPYLKLIGLIVAVSIMAINHLLAGLKKARAALPPPRETITSRDPVAAASTRQDLNAEVKEFLRRAAQQRSGQSASPRQPTSVATGTGPRHENQGTENQRIQGQRKRKHKSQTPKPVAPAVPKLEDSLANRHVTSRLESSSLDDRAEQLSNLDNSNGIDAHVQQSLDHQVGQLTSGLARVTTNAPISDTAATVSDSQNSFAADIAALVRNPQSIRTAIILNEILARPTDRW